MDVYWQKTLLFDYKTIKCSSMDMSKVLLECTGVSDGVDQCLVGFLHHHQVKHISTNWKELFVKLQRCTLTTLKSVQRCHHKHKKNFGCAIVAIVSSNKHNKVRKAKSQITKSSQKTPTNVKTSTNTNSKSPKQKEIHWECNRREHMYKRIGN